MRRTEREICCRRGWEDCVRGRCGEMKKMLFGESSHQDKSAFIMTLWELKTLIFIKQDNYRKVQQEIKLYLLEFHFEGMRIENEL